jgi:superfamily II DNA or RNA helicase
MSKSVADCIREIENWSSYENQHKLDHISFQPAVVKKQLSLLSPKIDAILQKIKQLDKEDLERDGHLYKHLIFSDLKAAGGAKSIASAFLANGFHLVYDSKLILEDPIQPSPNNFALLTSSKLYQKDVGIRFRRKVLTLFNERPNNIFGQHIRFLILDAGFKEGIDVFDIRYIHILETPITTADKKQIIGRGTRFCGQKGLQFDKKLGWPLYVYQYKTTIPEQLQSYYKTNTLYELFLKKSNLDATLQKFGNELERRAIQSAVDLKQNAPLHLLNPNFEELYNEADKSFPKPMHTDDIDAAFTIKYGMKIEKNAPINCKNGCKSKIALAIPVPFMLIVWYIKKIIDRIPDKRPKSFLCKQMIENKDYCERLNKAWRNPDIYILRNEQRIYNKLKNFPKGEAYDIQKKSMMEYVKNIIASFDLPPEPPTKDMSYGRLQQFIDKRYKHQVWDKPTIENLCLDKNTSESNKKSNELLEFTPSQDFVRNYFQPESIYKGLLLWHSVGTGKTCTGIATATTSFEKQGYTILWVTRHTLRGDIWKNMFNQVCSLVLRENLPKDFSPEQAIRNPFEYISQNWITPITYKQFSNLLMKRNQFYDEMLKRNGEKDPLRKTLIIIDEAHKLLSPDLPSQERPNFKVLRDFIHKSYLISGKDSVRLLLMSATPYTTNPMHMIQLINLLKDKNHLPETYDTFREQFLDETGEFKDPYAFVEQISGYISYLNRETDMRQFAIPTVEEIDVPMSLSNVKELRKQLQTYTTEYEDALYRIDKNKEAIRTAKEKVKIEKKILTEKCKSIKNREEKAKCKEQIQKRVADFEHELFSESKMIIEKNEEKVKKIKPEITKLNREIKDYKHNDLSQERVLEEKCLRH